MSLADYLAKNYLNADPKPDKKSKKRKRKHAQEGLTIADDDATGWETKPDSKRDDDDRPITVSHRSAEFRKAKTSNWQTLSGAPAKLPSRDDDDAAAADAILASAAAESEARANAAEDEDEAPAIVDDDGVERTATGVRAGLTTGAEFAADMAAARVREGVGDGAGRGDKGGPGDTIYRDASGRIINVAMKRAELRQKEAEKAAKEAQEKESAKGDVQRAQKEKRREELSDAKLMTFARHADDKEMNEEMMAQERWNDPAAGFLSEKKKGKSVTGRPLYQGSAAPNRYGIRPGHKWDGVDRGTGFESEWFKARNRRGRLEALDYAWQMDE